MALVLKDRVREASTTTGTGAMSLAGAVSGYQPFSAIGNGNVTYYTIYDSVTGDWEVGVGTYTLSGSTLSRDAVYASSNGGSLVNFAAGTKDVFCTYPAGKAIYEEVNGKVLIDGGPITVVGSGVTSYTTFSAALGEAYGNVNTFAQFYAQNYNNGSEASGDFVVYRNDALTDTSKFVDMGINSTGYSSPSYPIFTPGSAYLFNDGGELFVGSGTDDLVLFAGGVDTTDIAARIDKTTKSFTTVADANIGGAFDVTGAATFGSTVTLNANPVGNLEAATKQYVDSAAATGFTVHPSVRLTTAAALPANTYNNGAAGVGATLTANANGALSVDGVAVAAADRVLIINEAAPANNGAYVVTQTGSAGTPYILTRATDFDQAAAGEIANNAYFFTTEGATHAGSAFILSQTAAITVGTTALPFTLFADQLNYVGGTNIDVTGLTISLTGTVAATNGGTGTSTVTTGDLLYGSGTNTWSKLALGSAYKSLTVNAAGTQVAWNAVALDQSAAVSGSLGPTNGGTGLSSYAVGDVIYGSATDTLARLAGNTTTTKKFLGQTGTGAVSQAPVWEVVSASDVTGLAASATTDTTNAANISTGALPSGRLVGGYTGVTAVGTLTSGTWNATTIAANYGGTGFSSYTVGDLLYADTTSTLAKLADVATGNVLLSGGVGVAPSWGKVDLGTAVASTLSVSNGGTGVATLAANGVVLGNGTAAVQTVVGTVSGQLLTWNGTTWAATTPGATVSSITGTADQVIASASTGAVTLSLPQSIATTSGPQFGSLGVGTAASGVTGEVRATANVTAYYSSDKRLKENIRDIPNALDKVDAVGGKLFDWTDEYVAMRGGEDGYFVRKADFGVVAQDVQACLPEAVRTREDGMLAVDYEKLCALAFAAIKELRQEVEALKQQKGV